jgi:hypothetical protein
MMGPRTPLISGSAVPLCLLPCNHLGSDFRAASLYCLGTQSDGCEPPPRVPAALLQEGCCCSPKAQSVRLQMQTLLPSYRCTVYHAVSSTFHVPALTRSLARVHLSAGAWSATQGCAALVRVQSSVRLSEFPNQPETKLAPMPLRAPPSKHS